MIEKSLAANSEALFLRIVQLCFIPLFVGSKTSTPYIRLEQRS
ncbi:hypothetical protein S3E15_03233 [Bacillus mycoides]|uniref:Uncharacterized protein n=1 Tax=Bacillus mycoides TaxID=1405 RepID=A0A0D6SQ59_BACMY|nr:hypothetical protein bmyco0001_34770 [Bacillus mycoides DSM 2048]KIV70731.1 hypothetical protein SZ39_4107 [Bacillus mycoides]KUH46930.1 hypothetical protein M2E15_5240 [Bacillus mycoides]OSX94635.1 hypothetical protein S3E15_03233 [Bacillus mycoides]OSY10431.1 hypothetical protein BTJ44_00731 [Bacillus mycoides]